MRLILLILSILISNFCVSQDHAEAVKISWVCPDQVIDTSSFSVTDAEKLAQACQLTTPQLSLRLKSKIHSRIGVHFSFEVLHNQMRLYQTFIKINCNQSGKIISVLSNIQAENFRDLQDTCNVYIWSNERYSGALLKKVLDLEYIYIGGQIVKIYDLASYIQDTTLQSAIFSPDPITRSQTAYGMLISDSNDMNYPAIDSLYSVKDVPLQVGHDTIYFRNDFVSIANLTGDTGVVPFWVGSLPNLNRNDKSFESLNCLYHIYHFQKYIQTLGFYNLSNSQITVDPHGLKNDNSSYTPNNIKYGDGGVDDAEDMEVITHEYSHALIESASPGTNIGLERKSLDEGSCDYLATGYTRNISAFEWDKVFPWDGHNQYFAGRTITSAAQYPQNIGNSIHRNGEIWSSCLMQISNQIGREEMDKILLTAYYSSFANMTYPQFAKLLIQADSMLNQGKYQYYLCKYLSERGILNNDCYNAVVTPFAMPETRLLRQNGKTYIPNPTHSNCCLRIFTMDGKVVYQGYLSDEQFELESLNVRTGLYILEIESVGKWLRAKWVNCP